METIEIHGRIDSHKKDRKSFNLHIVENTPDYFDLDISKSPFVSSQAYEVIKKRASLKTIVSLEQLKFLIN